MRMFLTLKMLLTALAAAGSLLAVPATYAAEQFIPLLVYRSGPYAPNGIPFANGLADYLNLVNMRDGGVYGVTLTFEECETGYATDRGVECYERLKGKGPTRRVQSGPARCSLPRWRTTPVSSNTACICARENQTRNRTH